MSKWKGAAAWSAKEARAGDRLPYARLVDENTLLLRDGSVMTALQVPGLLFETEDSEALNAHAATREVMLRSTLDARFVMYHHVIRRRVEVDLEAAFPDQPPYRCALAGTAGIGIALHQRPVHHPDPPPRARQGGLGRTHRQGLEEEGQGWLRSRGRSQGPALAARRRDRAGRLAFGLWGAAAGRLCRAERHHQ